MRSLLQILMLIFATLSVQAQDRDTIHLWSEKVPNEEMPKHAPRQTDNISGDVTRLTDVTDPALVVFEPKASNDLGVGIIVCPGGGYSILAVDKEGYEIAEWLNTLGYTAFVLQYRVPKNELGALNDVQRAIRMVRHKADHYNLDTDKIGLMGFSAGGSLSARATTRHAIDSYPGMDDIDQLSCYPNYALLIYPAYLDRGEQRGLTPELVMTADVPPFFIFGTADDKYGNSSLVFAQALRDNKSSVELHVLSTGGHGYGMRPGNVAAEAWPSLAELWLETTIATLE